MIFPDYRMIEIFGSLTLLIALSLIGWIITRGRHPGLQYPVRGAALLTGPVASFLLLVLASCDAFAVTTRTPVYSPSGQQAMLVTTVDEGAVGGFTTVTLYSNYGLRADLAATGEWRFVEPKDVQWTAEDRVVMRYDSGYRDGPECHDVARVKVICMPCKLNGNVC